MFILLASKPLERSLKDKKQKKALVFDKNSMESKMKHFQSLKLDIDRTFFCRELTRRMHFDPPCAPEFWC